MLCDLTREVERLHTSRVGHNDIYPASIRNVLQGNHQIYGYIRRMYVRFWPTPKKERRCKARAASHKVR